MGERLKAERPKKAASDLDEAPLRVTPEDFRFPHIHRPLSSAQLFWGLSAALLPLTLSALVFCRPQAVRIFTGVILGGQLGGWFAGRLFHKPWAGADGHDLFLSLMLACLLPPDTPAVWAGIGSLGMVFFLKEIPGGIGAYLFHPPVLMAFILIGGTGQLSQGSALDGGVLFSIAQTPHALGGVYFPALGITYLFLAASRRLSWELPWIYLFPMVLTAGLSHADWNLESAMDACLLSLFAGLDWSTLPSRRRGRQYSLLLAGGFGAWLWAGTFFRASWLAGILLAQMLTPWIEEWTLTGRFIKKMPRESR